MTKNNLLLNILKKNYLGILIPVFLIPLYPQIIHGDYEFYGLLYNNHEFIYDNLFFMNDMTTGFVCEWLFGIMIVIFSKFISYEIFNFSLDILMFSTIIILMKKYIKNELFIFLILISSSYIFTTALSSIRSELFFTFFILSFLHKDKSNYFYISYYFAFLTHSSLSFAFYIFFFILFFKEMEVMKKITILRIILLILPIIISAPLIFSKAIGYTDQNMKEPEIVYSNQDVRTQLLLKIENLKFQIQYEKNDMKTALKEGDKLKYDHAFKKLTLLELELEKSVNKIKLLDEKTAKDGEDLNSKLTDFKENFSEIKNNINENFKIQFQIIKLDFSKDNFLSKKSLLIPDITINFRIDFFYLLVIIVFHVFMFIFQKRDITLYLNLSFAIIFFGLIGTTKAGLILFVFTVLFLIKNFSLLKNKLINQMFIFIFLFPFLLKNISMVHKIIFYGNIF